MVASRKANGNESGEKNKEICNHSPTPQGEHRAWPGIVTKIVIIGDWLFR